MIEYIYEVTTDADGIDCYIKRGELIRCKDCRWYGDQVCAIMIVDDSDKPRDTDYCSFAERKIDGKE